MRLTSLPVVAIFTIAVQISIATTAPPDQLLIESRGSPSGTMPTSPELQYGRLNRHGERLRATQWSSGSLSSDWRQLPFPFQWGTRRPSWTDSSHYRSQSPSVPSSPDGIEQASQYSTPSRGPSGDHQLSPEREQPSSPSIPRQQTPSSRLSSPIRLLSTDRITGTSQSGSPNVGQPVGQPARAEPTRSHSSLGQRIKVGVKKVFKNAGKAMKKCVSCGQPGSPPRLTTHGAPRHQRWR